MAGDIHAITDAYVALRYAGSHADLRLLRRQVAAFTP
jgi:hypothetical protein